MRMAMAKQFLPMGSAITSWKLSFWFRSKRNEIWTALLSTRAHHLSFHEVQHENPLSNVPRKIDIKIWRRWMASKIRTSQGWTLPQLANRYLSSNWRQLLKQKLFFYWAGKSDQSNEQTLSSHQNLCATRKCRVKRDVVKILQSFSYFLSCMY